MDIFCQIKTKLKDQIVDETKNFYVLHDGYPLMEGHLLLIPKIHIDCFLNLDKKLIKDFQVIKNKTIKFLSENYKQPVIFEHGIAGQTVLHAHLHLLPTNKFIDDQLNEFGELSAKPKVPYLYFEFNSQIKFFEPIKEIKPGLLHSYLYANVLNRSTSGLERAKDLKNWLANVKSKYIIWQREKSQV